MAQQVNRGREMPDRHTKLTEASKPEQNETGSLSATGLKIAPVLVGFLPESEVAAELGLMPRTLRRYRELGEGPAYVVLGRRAFYPRAALTDWIESKIVHPVRERKSVGRNRRSRTAA
jgi:hypothetical protein